MRVVGQRIAETILTTNWEFLKLVVGYVEVYYNSLSIFVYIWGLPNKNLNSKSEKSMLCHLNKTSEVVGNGVKCSKNVLRWEL